MKKGIKALVILLSVAVAGAAVTGGLVFARNSSRKPVGVFAVSDIAMTDYWGDTSQTSGMVQADGIQAVYLSETLQVTEVYVEEGQQVSKGDPLIAYDSTLSEIEMERKEIAVQELELNLQKANDQLWVMYTYKPYTPPPPEPEPETPPEPKPEDAVEVPFQSGGSGAADDPYTYIWGENAPLTAEFLQKAMGESKEASFVFEQRQGNAPNGDVLYAFGVRVSLSEEGVYSFVMFDPATVVKPQEEEPSEEPEEQGKDENSGYIDPGPQYTAAEIAKMIKDQQDLIRDLDLKLRMEKVKLEQAKAEYNGNQVLAEIDGVVKTLNDEDTARENGMPLLEISSGGGYYATGTLSEMELSTVEIGQTVTVTSWENYGEYEGTVTEISRYPAENGYSWSNGNNNVSYYPFRVRLSDDAQLRIGEYVEIRYAPVQEVRNSFYLENPFVRRENGKNYVFVRGEEDKLEKREVTVGKSLWGSYTEILSGITLDDAIAFPYGKDVMEGAKTKEGSFEDLYG